MSHIILLVVGQANFSTDELKNPGLFLHHQKNCTLKVLVMCIYIKFSYNKKKLN